MSFKEIINSRIHLNAQHIGLIKILLFFLTLVILLFISVSIISNKIYLKNRLDIIFSDKAYVINKLNDYALGKRQENLVNVFNTFESYVLSLDDSSISISNMKDGYYKISITNFIENNKIDTVDAILQYPTLELESIKVIPIDGKYLIELYLIEVQT